MPSGFSDSSTVSRVGVSVSIVESEGAGMATPSTSLTKVSSLIESPETVSVEVEGVVLASSPRNWSSVAKTRGGSTPGSPQTEEVELLVLTAVPSPWSQTRYSEAAKVTPNTPTEPKANDFQARCLAPLALRGLPEGFAPRP